MRLFNSFFAPCDLKSFDTLSYEKIIVSFFAIFNDSDS